MARVQLGPAANVRIGIHTSSAGGLALAAERAAARGCDSFQIFSASPRLWPLHTLNEGEISAFRARRNEAFRRLLHASVRLQHLSIRFETSITGPVPPVPKR